MGEPSSTRSSPAPPRSQPTAGQPPPTVMTERGKRRASGQSNLPDQFAGAFGRGIWPGHLAGAVCRRPNSQTRGWAESSRCSARLADPMNGCVAGCVSRSPESRDCHVAACAESGGLATCARRNALRGNALSRGRGLEGVGPAPSARLPSGPRPRHRHQHHRHRLRHRLVPHWKNPRGRH